MSATAPPATTAGDQPATSANDAISPVRAVFRELTRSVAGFIGLVMVVVIVLVSIVAPMILGRTIPGDPANAWSPPSSAHWLGLEGNGRDILQMVLTGGTTVIFVGFLAAATTTVIAVAIGASAGYFGGRFDAVMLQITDIVMTIPQIVLLAVVGSFYRMDSPVVLALIIGMLSWPVLMRSIRAQVLSLKEREFVEASQLLDVGWARIIFIEIVPNMASYILINFIIAVTNAIYALVGLYLLGLAPQSGSNWGIMINDAWTQGAATSPQAMAFIVAPVVAIILLQLGLIMLTRTLEEILNPRLRDR